MRKLAVLALFSLLASSCMTGPGVPKDRIMLGERSVAFKADHDVIQIGSYQGVFRSLFFVVEKNDIQIYNIVLTYGNGEREKINTRLNFGADSRSRSIAFEGGKRRIKTITFTYRTVGSWQEGRARVVVYGVR